MKASLFGFALAVLLAACAGDAANTPEANTSDAPPSEGDAQAQAIIAEAREAHGVGVLDSATVAFGFRGDRVTARHDASGFRYAKHYADTTDVLASDTLYRAVDGQRVPLSEEERRGLESTVNSVVYFALLPEALADPAVVPRYLGADTIRKGGSAEPYHEVEVTFRQEGGGRDWQDRFVYWIHQDRHTMDYLAYHYHTGGGGSRFREAVDPRRVNGVRFQDYLNYRTADSVMLGEDEIERYDDLLERDALEKVSEIRLDSIRFDSIRLDSLRMER